MASKYDWVYHQQQYLGSGAVVSYSNDAGYQNVILHCCGCLTKIARLLNTTYHSDQNGNVTGLQMTVQHLEKPDTVQHFTTGITPFYCRHCTSGHLYYVCENCAPTAFKATDLYDVHLQHHLPVNLVEENAF